MARYFFHTFDGKHNAYDTDGVECPSIREVRLHMVKLAEQEVMSFDPQKETWAIEALDDRGVIGLAVISRARGPSPLLQRLGSLSLERSLFLSRKTQMDHDLLSAIFIVSTIVIAAYLEFRVSRQTRAHRKSKWHG